MITLSDERYITAFSPDARPVLRVESGATVRMRTMDCYMNNLRAPDDPRGPAQAPPIGCNPATGPIYVVGARPGDTLKCEILSIEVDDYASMRISHKGGLMRDRVTQPIVRAIPLRDGVGLLSGVKLPLKPMIGVIGVAPASGEIDTETPGAHGGNMDTRYIGAGATLYLPVRAEGALFALGDVHAQMGDGEVCICGLECAAEVTMRLSVISGRQETWPVLECEHGLCVIASAATLDGAGKQAADAMLDFLLKRTAINVNELILLMSLICDLEISQVVDPLVTARMRLRPGILPDITF